MAALKGLASQNAIQRTLSLRKSCPNPTDHQDVGRFYKTHPAPYEFFVSY